MRELDSAEVQETKAHPPPPPPLKRRTYQNADPNHFWHYDVHDKFRSYGFPTHGCIDGSGRLRIGYLWHVPRIYQANSIILFESSGSVKSVSIDLITNIGLENGTKAGIHAFVRNEPDGHGYMPLPRNQISESWWSFLRRSHVAWWINFFKDFCNQRTIDLISQHEKECLRFNFGGLLHSYVSNI